MTGKKRAFRLTFQGLMPSVEHDYPSTSMTLEKTAGINNLNARNNPSEEHCRLFYRRTTHGVLASVPLHARILFGFEWPDFSCAYGSSAACYVYCLLLKFSEVFIKEHNRLVILQ